MDRKQYMRDYQKANIKAIRVSVTHEEYDAFDAFCEDIGESKAGLLKRLINAEAVKHGYQPIFETKRRI